MTIPDRIAPTIPLPKMRMSATAREAIFSPNRENDRLGDLK